MCIISNSRNKRCIIMNENFTETDWKIYKSKLPIWQEKYIASLLKKYNEIINDCSDSSKRFWHLESEINKDKNYPGVTVERKRSNMISTLVTFLNDGVIGISDIDDFSEELKETVKKFL